MMYHRPVNHKTTSNQQVNQVINSEQFAQIITAILSGKYSWACVLLLRFCGHNPIHYIPYRTYNRILKENCQVGRAARCQARNPDINNCQTRRTDSNTQACSQGIADLTYLEALDEPHIHVHGRGSSQRYLGNQSQGHSSAKASLLQLRDKIFSICS